MPVQFVRLLQTIVFCAVGMGVVVTQLLTGCATYVATSGAVAVKDDRPAGKPEPRAPVTNTRPATRDVRVAMAAGFSSRDRLAIEEYFAKPRGVHPKQESLPAGFSVHDRLPAQVHGQPLPRALETRLTVLPEAYERLQVGQDVVLMERDTRVVLDLLRGVIAE